MFIKKKLGHRCLVLVPVAVLATTGCSSEPSSSDIKAALENDVKRTLEMQTNMTNVFGSRGKPASATGPKLEDIRKVGCKEDGENAYRCDVELVIINAGEKKSSVMPARLVKTSSGWKAME